VVFSRWSHQTMGSSFDFAQETGAKQEGRKGSGEKAGLARRAQRSHSTTFRGRCAAPLLALTGCLWRVQTVKGKQIRRSSLSVLRLQLKTPLCRGVLSYVPQTVVVSRIEKVGHANPNQLACFSTYWTLGKPLKCSSCVQRVALFSREIARMMLSAIGNFNSADNIAALIAIGVDRSTTSPLTKSATRNSAIACPWFCKTFLNTSYTQITGTTKCSTSSIAGAKNAAFSPSAKYSNQPEVSTTFIRDLPLPVPRWYSYL